MENDNTKYEETSVTGESWVRAKRIIIENPLNEDNLIKFVEEKVITIDGKSVHVDEGVISELVGLEDMNTLFDVVDVSTGELTGQQMTYGTLYSLIFSVYLKMAKDRDAEESGAE